MPLVWKVKLIPFCTLKTRTGGEKLTIDIFSYTEKSLKNLGTL